MLGALMEDQVMDNLTSTFVVAIKRCGEVTKTPISDINSEATTDCFFAFPEDKRNAQKSTKAGGRFAITGFAGPISVNISVKSQT